jgi:hypothetical protein
VLLWYLGECNPVLLADVVTAVMISVNFGPACRLFMLCVQLIMMTIFPVFIQVSWWAGIMCRNERYELIYDTSSYELIRGRGCTHVGRI